MNAATRKLIDDGHRFSPFYEGVLANHLPMAVSALDRLGVSEREIADFAGRYSEILEPMPAPTGVITESTTAEFLGRREAVASWIEFFKSRIAAAGAEATTRLWLDRLMPGISSTAFHGLLRLAYAVDDGGDDELAHALGQWAADYTTLGPLPSLAAAGRSPEAALALLSGSKGRYRGDNIIERMRQVCLDASFPGVVASAGSNELTTPALARAMLAAYRATRSFTVLHGITACHAFRVLTPLMADASLARLYLWQALACAYISAGGPEAGAPLSGNDGLSWEQIVRLAAVAREEHDVKLVYTCRREFDFCGDDAYRLTAGAYMSSRAG